MPLEGVGDGMELVVAEGIAVAIFVGFAVEAVLLIEVVKVGLVVEAIEDEVEVVLLWTR